MARESDRPLNDPLAAAVTQLARERMLRQTAVDDIIRELKESGCARLRPSHCHRLSLPTHVTVRLGLPTVPIATQLRWIGLWVTAGEVPRPLRAVVSSRLGTRLDTHSEWFAALRHLIHDQLPGTLVSSDGMTADRFLTRWSGRSGRPLFRVRVIAGTERSRGVASVRCLAALGPPDAVGDDELVVISPLCHATDDDMAKLPLPDRIVMLLADEVCALRLRKGSQSERLIRKRLRDLTELRTCVLDAPKQTGGVFDGLRADGASVLRVTGPGPAVGTASAMESRGKSRLMIGVSKPDAVVRLVTAPFNDYLIHWTRAQQRWPDERDEDYVDSLLDGIASDRSARGSLMRILRQQLLRGSGWFVRGGRPVVCFAEIPITELASRRVYRRHLRRWDCELFGVGIRRCALERCGVRAVRYVEKEAARFLAADWRFHQVKESGRSGIDWSQEQEWRLPGDLELSQFGRDEMFVFVPTALDADALRDVRWPVVLVGAP